MSYGRKIDVCTVLEWAWISSKMREKILPAISAWGADAPNSQSTTVLQSLQLRGVPIHDPPKSGGKQDPAPEPEDFTLHDLLLSHVYVQPFSVIGPFDLPPPKD